MTGTVALGEKDRIGTDVLRPFEQVNQQRTFAVGNAATQIDDSAFTRAQLDARFRTIQCPHRCFRNCRIGPTHYSEISARSDNTGQR